MVLKSFVISSLALIAFIVGIKNLNLNITRNHKNKSNLYTTIYDRKPVSTWADPKECYHCTLLNGQLCNTPVNIDRIRKQSCSDIPTNKNTTSKTVCYTVTATWLGVPITERGCYYAEMENEDLCTYFKRTEASGPFTKDYTCKLCSEDLCNDG